MAFRIFRLALLSTKFGGPEDPDRPSTIDSDRLRRQPICAYLRGTHNNARELRDHEPNAHFGLTIGLNQVEEAEGVAAAR